MAAHLRMLGMRSSDRAANAALTDDCVAQHWRSRKRRHEALVEQQLHDQEHEQHVTEMCAPMWTSSIILCLRCATGMAKPVTRSSAGAMVPQRRRHLRATVAGYCPWNSFQIGSLTAAHFQDMRLFGCHTPA